MMGKDNLLIGADSFFKEENDEFMQELEIEDILVDIASEFINYRADNNMTQKELAKKLKITQAMVSKLESGDYNPSVRMLFEISRKLGWDFHIEFKRNIGVGKIPDMKVQSQSMI